MDINKRKCGISRQRSDNDNVTSRAACLQTAHSVLRIKGQPVQQSNLLFTENKQRENDQVSRTDRSQRKHNVLSLSRSCKTLVINEREKKPDKRIICYRHDGTLIEVEHALNTILPTTSTDLFLVCFDYIIWLALFFLCSGFRTCPYLCVLYFAIQLHYLDAGLCVTATCITQNMAISYSPNLLVELGTVRYIVILSAFHSIPAECSAAAVLCFCAAERSVHD